jgi:hypothetical protein
MRLVVATYIEFYQPASVLRQGQKENGMEIDVERQQMARDYARASRRISYMVSRCDTESGKLATASELAAT